MRPCRPPLDSEAARTEHADRARSPSCSRRTDTSAAALPPPPCCGRRRRRQTLCPSPRGRGRGRPRISGRAMLMLRTSVAVLLLCTSADAGWTHSKRHQSSSGSSRHPERRRGGGTHGFELQPRSNRNHAAAPCAWPRPARRRPSRRAGTRPAAATRARSDARCAPPRAECPALRARVSMTSPNRLSD